MSTRDLDGVLQALADYREQVRDRYRGGVDYPSYMRNVGREDAIDALEQLVLEIKKRGGDDDGDSERPTRRRGRRSQIATDISDDWDPTPGTVVDDPLG